MSVKGFIELYCTQHATTISIAVAEIKKVVPAKNNRCRILINGDWHDCNLTYAQVMQLIGNAK